MLKKQKTNSNPRVPSGMIAHTEKGYFYIKGDKRFKFISDRARVSWKLREITTTESAMSDVKLSGIIGFRDGSLIRDVSNCKTYLIADNKKMLVVDPDDLYALGFKKHEIVLVSKREADFQKEGGHLNGR